MLDDRIPQVLALSPPDGQQDVGVNPYYAVRFDEAIATLGASALGNMASLQLSEDDTVVRYARLGSLAPDSEVTETIPGFTDLSGNGIPDTSTTFTTTDGPDLVAGVVTSVSVESNAQNVALNPILAREFSEPLDPVSVTESGVYLYDTSTGERVDTTLSLSSDGMRLTMVPVAALASGRQYYWYWNALQDLSGNSISYSYYSYYNYFTTGFAEDNTAPLLEVATVFEGQVDVPTNVRLQAGFDEPLSPQALAGVSVTDSGGQPVVASISLSSDRHTIIVVPKQLLSANSSYTFNIAGVQDISGNALATPIAIGFTTGSGIDNVRGNIQNWSFANNAELPLNPLLEVSLTERVDPTTIHDASTFRLYSLTQSRNVPGNVQVSADGRVITYLPDEELQAGHSYRLYTSYSSNRLYDLAGNYFNGTYRNFTTGLAEDNSDLALLQATVFDGMVDVPVNLRINLLFNKPTNSVSAAESITLFDGANSVIPTNLSFSGALDLWTLTPVELLSPISEYRLVLSGVEDYAGNTIAPDPSQFTFTTSDISDNARGNIIAWSFEAGSTLDPDASFEVTLDEPVDITTVDSARFYLRNLSTSQNVNGIIGVAADRMSMTFTPVEALAANSSYRLYVSYSYFYDLAGNLINRTYRDFVTAE